MIAYKIGLIRQVRQHIKRGGIIAYPTESCYGFGCDPFNRNAINKILRLKGRCKTKGLIVVAGEIKQLKSLTQIGAISPSELSHYWPGPYTLILAVNAQVPSNLTGQHQRVAVRVSKHQLVQQLTKQLHSALVSTSANKAGAVSVKNYRECQRQFGQSVLVLPGTTNFASKPSTIIDWQTRKILR